MNDGAFHKLSRGEEHLSEIERDANSKGLLAASWVWPMVFSNPKPKQKPRPKAFKMPATQRFRTWWMAYAWGTGEIAAFLAKIKVSSYRFAACWAVEDSSTKQLFSRFIKPGV